MATYYDDRIFPVLTPLAVDPGHPFPYISNLALSIAAHVADPDTGERRFVRLKVPDVFPRLRARSATVASCRPRRSIAAHLHTLFVGMIVEEWAMFRVTRNADLTLEEDEADDLLEAVELELRRRRFNKAIRLEVADIDQRRDARPARPRARTRRAQRVAPPGADRPQLPVAAARRSTGPTSRTARGRRSPPAGCSSPRRPSARSSR